MRGRDRHIRLHRGLVQPDTQALWNRIPVPGRVREKTRHERPIHQVLNRPLKRVNSVHYVVGFGMHIEPPCEYRKGVAAIATRAPRTGPNDWAMAVSRLRFAGLRTLCRRVLTHLLLRIFGSPLYRQTRHCLSIENTTKHPNQYLVTCLTQMIIVAIQRLQATTAVAAHAFA